MKFMMMSLMMLLSLMTFSQNKIIVLESDSIVCSTGSTLDCSAKATTKIFFNKDGFIINSDIRVLSFIAINSQFDKDDYRIFEDTGHSLQDTTTNQNSAIYHNEKYATQVVIYFIGNDMKMIKKDKTYLIFKNIKK